MNTRLSPIIITVRRRHDVVTCRTGHSPRVFICELFYFLKTDDRRKVFYSRFKISWIFHERRKFDNDILTSSRVNVHITTRLYQQSRIVWMIFPYVQRKGRFKGALESSRAQIHACVLSLFECLLPLLDLQALFHRISKQGLILCAHLCKSR